MDLTEKILFYMKRYHMIPENKNIVVGLSGGADSVCLLYVLAALRKKLGLQLCAVHVHHGLRGVEADADEAYVRDICRAWDVPLKAIRIEAAALAKQWGIGCEEAGRRARYEIFEECLQEMGDCHGAIAVAHHRDDCAETLLFHMFRGTGLDGMAGIRPVRKTERESMIIRPLLETGKTEIEKIRGVSSEHAVSKLVEYNLVQELGRLDAPGRPLLFGTTEEFLRSFGVSSIDELPVLSPVQVEEFKQEAEEEMHVKLDV